MHTFKKNAFEITYEDTSSAIWVNMASRNLKTSSIRFSKYGNTLTSKDRRSVY